MTDFAVLPAASAIAAANRSRKIKVAAFVEVFRSLQANEVAVAAAMLTGEIRQGSIGVGWGSLRQWLGVSDPDQWPAVTAPLQILDIDQALSALGEMTGAGSQAQRRKLLEELHHRATVDEIAFLHGLLTGGLRQGAQAGIVTEAIAQAAEVPSALVRRAAMLRGDLAAAAQLAMTGGADALKAQRLEVGVGLQPMLAASSPTITEAVVHLQGDNPETVVSVEWKLDGARVQAHRDGEEIRLLTRNLNDVTARLPGIVALVRSFPSQQLVLDGEAIGWHDDGTTDGSGDKATPQAFQDTMSSFGRHGDGSGSQLGARFFDILHRDGVDLLDHPLAERIRHLDELCGHAAMPRCVTNDPQEAESFGADALRLGHEGVMVKALDAPYEAGRRGATWRKVKPVITLDLVVLAIEWGSGRREGWLSNLHLGARAVNEGNSTGTDDWPAFVMVGKTFKGMTDEMLRWQTERFLALETHRQGRTVFVPPVQVVEIAVDGVQRSTRYPGGVALRFARVKSYRPDKGPDDADSVATVQDLLKVSPSSSSE